MLTPPRHHLRPALAALAALAGLLLAPSGASASCEGMASAGSCPPSMAACCCSKPDEPETIRPSAVAQRVCPATGACSCSERPEIPAEPAPRPARLSDDGRADRGETLAVELADLRPSPLSTAPRPAPDESPPRVPLYLRHSRFLI